MDALTSPTTLLLLLVALQVLICDRGKHGPQRPGHSAGRPFALVGRREADARDRVRKSPLVSCRLRSVSGVFGRSVDAGAVAGRAARAWPRVL